MAESLSSLVAESLSSLVAESLSSLVAESFSLQAAEWSLESLKQELQGVEGGSALIVYILTVPWREVQWKATVPLHEQDSATNVVRIILEAIFLHEVLNAHLLFFPGCKIDDLQIWTGVYLHLTPQFDCKPSHFTTLCS